MIIIWVLSWIFQGDTDSLLAVSGTTTATVLTRAIFAEGAKSVAAGMNPMDLRRGINIATQAVVDHLKAQATNISTTEEISQVFWWVQWTI